MSNPDTGTTSGASGTSGATGGASFSFSFVVGLLLFLITKNVVQAVTLDTTGKIVMLIIGISVIAFVISLINNYLSQLYYCGKVDNSKALSGGIPSAAAVLVGGIISSISYCRIPIASLFAPMYLDADTEEPQPKDVNASNASLGAPVKICRVTNLTLEYAEANYPAIIGLTWGFYAMITMTIGTMIGSGIATNCRPF
jgi:hypothetical protein